MRRRHLLVLLGVLALPAPGRAQEATSQLSAENAAGRAAARAMVAADPTGTAAVQPPQAQVILEATEEGGRAKAVMGFGFERAKVALELSTPFQAGSSEADFLTLDRVPGDAVARASYAYEVLAPPADLAEACGLANLQVIRSYRKYRERLTPITRSPPPDLDKASTAALAGYARPVAAALKQTTELSAAATAAETAARNAVCAAESTKDPTRFVPDLIGVSPADLDKELLGRAHHACNLAGISIRARREAAAGAAATAITRLYDNSQLAAEVQAAIDEELAKLPLDATQDEKDEVAKQARKDALAKLRAERQGEIQKALAASVGAALAAADQAFLAALRLDELIRSYGAPAKDPNDPAQRAADTLALYANTNDFGNRAEVVTAALVANWPFAGPPPPEPMGDGGAGAAFPPPAATELTNRLGAAEGAWTATFQTAMLAALGALPNPPPHWAAADRQAVVDEAAKKAGTGPVAEGVARAYLIKLIPAYATLVTSFNQLPFDQLIEVGEGACGVAQVEARIAAMPRGHERNELFQAYLRGLPTLVHVTTSGQAGSADFKWLASFPPTIDQNKVKTEEDTRYNSSIGAGVTLFNHGWYYTSSYSRQRTYKAKPPVNVCLPLTGGTSGSLLCSNRSPGPPGVVKPQVVELAARHFWSPELAINLQALYDFDVDSLNPHVALYFLPQKKVGLRGGLDLGYVTNHPERGDRFEARVFIGTPLKLWD
jgi:hypothetical protein